MNSTSNEPAPLLTVVRKRTCTKETRPKQPNSIAERNFENNKTKTYFEIIGSSQTLSGDESQQSKCKHKLERHVCFEQLVLVLKRLTFPESQESPSELHSFASVLFCVLNLELSRFAAQAAPLNRKFVQLNYSQCLVHLLFTFASPIHVLANLSKRSPMRAHCEKIRLLRHLPFHRMV
jgi:hypothetical protein